MRRDWGSMENSFLLCVRLNEVSNLPYIPAVYETVANKAPKLKETNECWRSTTLLGTQCIHFSSFTHYHCL